MNTRLGIYQLLFCCIILSVFSGCDTAKDKKLSYETLKFNVDEVLLEPRITDKELKITLSAPKNWKKIDDSMLSVVVDKLDTDVLDDLSVVPRWIFLNVNSGAMCVVSKLDGMVNVSDAGTLKKFNAAYQLEFPNATVQQTSFIKDSFTIHQIMVNASDFVLIKMLFHSPDTLDFEVDYRLHKTEYELELRAIESSIGSIKPIL